MSKELCRLCTNASECTEILNIFARNHKDLLHRIKALTGIMLKNMRSLPQRVCLQCVQDLEQAYSFRERCIKSEAYYESTTYKESLKVKKQKKPADVDKDFDSNAPLKSEPMELAFETATEIDTEMVLLKCEAEELNELRNSCQETDEFSLDGEKFLPLLESPLKDEQHSPALANISPISEQVTLDQSTSVGTTTTGVPIVISRESAKTRKQRKPKEKQTDFICDQCGNHFRSYNHFQTHLKRHTGEKSHHCEVCPDKFFTHSELTRHMRRHTGERPFACKHCQRRFTDYSTRIKHERTHTNERPFACTHCDKAFTTSYILKNHMLVHTGERSFKCHSCNKSFQRQTHLIVHFRSIMHKQNEEKLQQLHSNTQLKI